MNDAGPILRTLAALVYVFLLAPAVIVLIVSFSADFFIVFPPSGVEHALVSSACSNTRR